MHKCERVRKHIVIVEQHVFSLMNPVPHHSDEPTVTVPFVVNSEGAKVQVNALIDTGALHSNYISERLAEILQADGNMGCVCSTNICSPVN